MAGDQDTDPAGDQAGGQDADRAAALVAHGLVPGPDGYDAATLAAAAQRLGLLLGVEPRRPWPCGGRAGGARSGVDRPAPARRGTFPVQETGAGARGACRAAAGPRLLPTAGAQDGKEWRA